MLKLQKITYWTLLTLISLAFVLASLGKIMTDPTAVAGFTSLHLPIWFMHFVGYAELLGAIGLWIPKLSRYAMGGLSIILLGAITTTSFFEGISTALIPFVYLLIFGVIIWSKKIIGNQTRSTEN
jgi:uncharacterized membrane protein YphA (DoxX/SURF4 family)